MSYEEMTAQEKIADMMISDGEGGRFFIHLNRGTTNGDVVLPDMLFLLEELDPKAATKITSEYSGAGWPYSMAGLSFGDWSDWSDEMRDLEHELHDDIENALTACAPDGVYYGGSEGDGSCLGFWQDDNEF
jgi:hypothetical protein